MVGKVRKYMVCRKKNMSLKGEREDILKFLLTITAINTNDLSYVF